MPWKIARRAANEWLLVALVANVDLKYFQGIPIFYPTWVFQGIFMTKCKFTWVVYHHKINEVVVSRVEGNSYREYVFCLNFYWNGNVMHDCHELPDWRWKEIRREYWPMLKTLIFWNNCKDVLHNINLFKLLFGKIFVLKVSFFLSSPKILR